ncbi:TrkH family potassium uptake protein [Anaerobaca lacustris]|uniref:Potassium transporter TrkG n=1 Tax=Anaerobaca lacustris TaxID=3044600 RepID=A0AAW6TYF2_9BACT|nr:potassium transporter TrkG [Sedimentisphaerales bacterium M17dextr]
MRIAYKNNTVEKIVTIVKTITSVIVVASFVILFGFDEPFVPVAVLFGVQLGMLCIFLAGKVVRFFNAESKKEYLVANWFEAPMLAALAIAALGSGRWFSETEADRVRHLAVGVYLIIEVTVKVCIATVRLAASGKNPTKTLIASFVVLIVTGGGLLMLPRASTAEPLSLIDALFTATSATCVTGLVVKDTGQDFTFMGQVIILILIQLGGLGIVVFGAVFALLLGQAFSVRESVAMQDVLSAQTLSRIGNMIFFIFVATLIVEATGAALLYPMWDRVPGWQDEAHPQWFCSVFHSISAFCNAGFGLFDDSLIRYNRQWQVYAVICPLIILGGLGFGVLYNLANMAGNRIQRSVKRRFHKQYKLQMEVPKRMRLQTKVVLSVSALLIVFGMLAILLLERYAGAPSTDRRLDVPTALFQSVTARTAGFNTVDISAMTPSSKIVLMMLMFIGGSPGSSAGGIKTVTLAVIIMTVLATLRKRGDVEMFRRSVRLVVVGRAITVALLFVVVLFATMLALSVTEAPLSGDFTMLDLMFESASALGTVGLSTGVTPTLTTAGKLIIIVVMLIGRLGPLTLLAALTFNLKPIRYNYPDEAIIVG